MDFALLESVPDAMVIADEAGFVVFVNEGGERLFGWTRAELLGQPVEVLLPSCGIPTEDQARVFDRFERAVPSQHFGGLGLGLYIARQIVEAHGGEIRVESAPVTGTTFTVLLPREAPTAGETEPTPLRRGA